MRLAPTERAKRLRELRGWVTWLVDTYEIPSGHLPDCWYQHSAMVADLGALHATWAGAYLDPRADPDRPARWHDTLDRTLRRLREWDRRGCARSGTHTQRIDVDTGGADHPDMSGRPARGAASQFGA